MTQLDLLAPHRLAHRGDPETSKEAAEGVRNFSGEHYRMILAVLKSGDYTAHQIADRCPLDMVQVNRRLHEMAKAGLLERTGERRMTPRGGRACVWKIIKAGNVRADQLNPPPSDVAA